ncbi:response regulator [Bacillus lacus]|uniref:Circadian input-output histidine kinase CikA n=1 Tax=Metabacillus lacus TaxID=1983721 RepID=A0A7X2IW44_9BACI|nr:response regulator [Metabacillus lacus]MRX70784.1 response regulator [Metabacillus lacus]
MTFKRKQMVGFGTILIFMLLLLSVLLFMVSNIRSTMTEITDDRYQKVKQSISIQDLYTSTERDVLILLNDEQEANVSAGIQAIQEKQSEIEGAMSRLEPTLNREEGRQMMAEIWDRYRSFAQTESAIAAQIAEGNTNINSSSAIFNDYQQERQALGEKISEFQFFQENLMDEAQAHAAEIYNQAVIFVVVSLAICLLMIFLISAWVIKSTSASIKSITGVMNNVDYTNLTSLPRVPVKTKDEIGQIAVSFNEMAASLEEYGRKEKDFTAKITEQNWLQTNVAEIATMYQGITEVEDLAKQFMNSIAEKLDASLGALYIRKGEGEETAFHKISSFADSHDAGRNSFRLGEGLIGQAALEQKTIIMQDIPEDFRYITTGLGEVKPKTLAVMPVLFEKKIVAMLEFASLHEISPLQFNLLTNVLDTLGITINSVLGRAEIERLLKESQEMTEELQTQSEELQAQSEEMQAQSEELQAQSEELRMTNEQLEERSKDAETKSSELERAKKSLEEKARELMVSSRYKSEFLANMSHELRTPLNSILILSEMLSEDSSGELTDEHKEFAGVIHSSGQELLSLINDILDLSKIEAGKAEVHFSEMNISELPDHIERNFSHIAQNRGLQLEVKKGERVPAILWTDEQRLQQVLKNLLSNALKFTEQGAVTVSIDLAPKASVSHIDSLENAEYWLQIAVRDTGIGIPADKQKLIFEAFQQADGAAMRKFGGTGLGLSISREFTRLLGGFIELESIEGEGSTFSIYIPSLPLTGKAEGTMSAEEEVQEATKQVAAAVTVKKPEIADAKAVFKNKRVLIVDDDNRNIYSLKSALQQEGMDVMTAQNGIECLNMLEGRGDIDIILMDIMMPYMDGYETMRNIRSNGLHPDIPIIALTAKAMKGDREKCLEAGASDYVSKPLKLDQLLSVMRVWLS